MDLSSLDLAALAQVVMQAVQSGNKGLIVAAALVVLIAVVKKVAPNVAWLQSDKGGALTVLLSSIGGAVSTGIMAGKPFSVALLLSGLKVGFMAAGGFATLTKLFPKVAALVGLKSVPVVTKEQAMADAAKLLK